MGLDGGRAGDPATMGFGGDVDDFMGDMAGFGETGLGDNVFLFGETGRATGESTGE